MSMPALALGIFGVAGAPDTLVGASNAATMSSASAASARRERGAATAMVSLRVAIGAPPSELRRVARLADGSRDYRRGRRGLTPRLGRPGAYWHHGPGRPSSASSRGMPPPRSPRALRHAKPGVLTRE